MASLLGLAMIVFAGWLAYRAFKLGQQLEKEKFERTNEFGVETFTDYDSMKKAARSEGANKVSGALLGCGALFIGFLGIMLFFGGMAMP